MHLEYFLGLCGLYFDESDLLIITGGLLFDAGGFDFDLKCVISVCKVNLYVPPFNH
jgi:hypothetical protein